MQPAPGMDVSIGQGHPMAPWIKHAPTIITVGMNRPGIAGGSNS